MLLFIIAIACDDKATAIATDTGVVNEEWGDTDTDTDTSGETGEDTSTTETGDTGTGPVPEEPTACQASMMATDPAYPVFPSWDGITPYVNFTVTLSGATREFATVSWGSANSPEGWFISCGEVIEGTTAIIRVEAMSSYDASTFGVTDPGDGTAADHNGYYWYPWSVTGGDLGGTQYVVQVDGQILHLVAVTPPPAE